MGFGTTVFTRLYFSHQTYNSLEEIQEKIEELESWIRNEREKIGKFAIMTEPDKWWRKDEAEVGETPMVWVENEIENALNAIEEYREELTRLYILEGAWDECHDKDGIGIGLPKNVKYGDSYIHGDFIKTKDPDTGEIFDPNDLNNYK